MTHEEIVERAKKTFPDKEGELNNLHTLLQRDGYVKALEEILGKSKKIWIARDSYEDPLYGLGLCAHFEKPERAIDCWRERTILFHLPWGSYPEVTWEGGPKEIEMILLD